MVEQLFATEQAPGDDLDLFRQRWMPGTCGWILSEPAFKTWMEDVLVSRVIWLNAPPATGKSIISAYIINHIRELGHPCQYFFFKYADHTRRSLVALLKSVGHQMAQDIPVFREELAQISREVGTLEKKDARFIWQKIFTSVLSRVTLPKPLCSIIDALDESDSPKDLLDILQSLSKFRTPIRVFITCRKIETLSRGFDMLSGVLRFDIGQDDNQTYRIRHPNLRQTSSKVHAWRRKSQSSSNGKCP